MKRIRKRVIGVAIGLALGWMAQGYWQAWQSPAAAQSVPAVHADAAHHQGPRDASAYSTSENVLPPLAVGSSQLIPVDRDIPWLGVALVTAMGLFAAAIVLGPLVSRFEDRQTATRDEDAQAAPVVHHHKGSH